MSREPKLAVLLPFKVPNQDFVPYNKRIFAQDAEILTLEKGRRAKETPVDGAITLREEVQAILQAQQDGYDALLVGCYLDVGVQEGRTLADMPVFGVAETSLRVCAMLGDRVGILTTSPYAKRGIESNLRRWGMERLACVRCLGMPVEQVFSAEPEQLAGAVSQAVLEMIEKDHITVTTFGSGALYRVYELVQKQLLDRGYDLPIVNSNRAAIEIVRALTRLGLKQSRRTYPEGKAVEKAV